MMIARDSQVIERLPFEQYNTLPGLRASALKHALTSALMYQHMGLQPHADRDTFRAGRAGHTAILEPARFLAEYAQWETERADGSKRIRRGKEWDEFEVLNKGKTILTPPMFETAIAQRDAVRGHPVAGPLFKGVGKNELTVTWRDGRTGEACRGRIDRLTADATLIDLKTTADASPDAFTRLAMRLHYPTQLAFYRDGVIAAGLPVEHVVIVAVQAKAPFDVIAYDLGPDVLQHGRAEYERAIDVVVAARKSKQWLGQATEHALPFMIPSWAMMGGAEIDTGTTAVTFDGEAI